MCPPPSAGFSFQTHKHKYTLARTQAQHTHLKQMDIAPLFILRIFYSYHTIQLIHFVFNILHAIVCRTKVSTKLRIEPTSKEIAFALHFMGQQQTNVSTRKKLPKKSTHLSNILPNYGITTLSSSMKNIPEYSHREKPNKNWKIAIWN